MKQSPLPFILLPPQLAEHQVHDLLHWLRNLLHALEHYYEDQSPRPDPHQIQLDFRDDDEDIPF